MGVGRLTKGKPRVKNRTTAEKFGRRIFARTEPGF